MNYFNNIWNPETFMENFWYSTIVSLKTLGITAIACMPFVLIFPPMIYVIGSMGAMALSFQMMMMFRVATTGYADGRHGPLPHYSDSTQTPEEWTAMQEARDNWDKKKRAKSKVASDANKEAAKEVLSKGKEGVVQALPAVKKVIMRLWKYTKIAFVCLVTLILMNIAWLVYTQ